MFFFFLIHYRNVLCGGLNLLPQFTISSSMLFLKSNIRNITAIITTTAVGHPVEHQQKILFILANPSWKNTFRSFTESQIPATRKITTPKLIKISSFTYHTLTILQSALIIILPPPTTNNRVSVMAHMVNILLVLITWVH